MPNSSYEHELTQQQADSFGPQRDQSWSIKIMNLGISVAPW